MKILLTGFAPFGGETVNPSYEAIKSLPLCISGTEIITVELPTAFKKSVQVLYKQLNELKPDIVLCVGQAGGRYELTLERVAINIDDARIPDNEGNQPIDEPVFSEGDAAYFTNLPIKSMVAEARKHGIPASISNTAGTFVCNHIMYSLMHYIKKNSLNIYGGFLHVPFIPEQVIGKGNLPFMSLDMMQKGILCMIESALKSVQSMKSDIKSIEGKLD